MICFADKQEPTFLDTDYLSITWKFATLKTHQDTNLNIKTHPLKGYSKTVPTRPKVHKT